MNLWKTVLPARIVLAVYTHVQYVTLPYWKYYNQSSARKKMKIKCGKTNVKSLYPTPAKLCGLVSPLTCSFMYFNLFAVNVGLSFWRIVFHRSPHVKNMLLFSGFVCVPAYTPRSVKLLKSLISMWPERKECNKWENNFRKEINNSIFSTQDLVVRSSTLNNFK